MKKLIKTSLLATLSLGLFVSNLSANDTIDYENKLSNNYTIADEIKMDGEVRLRYNQVDTNVENKGQAFTNRFLLNAYWQPISFPDTTIKATFNHVSNTLMDDYNNSKEYGDKPTYGAINDPSQTRLAEFNAKIKNVGGDGTLVLGRQVLDLDDGRFVSKTNDRQMYRTHDAISYNNEIYKDLNFDIFYSVKSYLEVGDRSNNLFQVSLKKDFMENGSYIRVFDIDVEDVNNIVGLTSRLNFGISNNDLSIYGAVASQRESFMGDKSNLPDALYYIGGVDYEFLSGFTFGAYYEVNETGFINLLGNNYKYGSIVSNTTNNGGGLGISNTETIGLKFDLKTDEVGTLGLNYKMISLNEGSGDVGTEIGFNWSYDIAKNINVNLEAKNFSSDIATFNDVSDAMISLSYKF